MRSRGAIHNSFWGLGLRAEGIRSDLSMLRSSACRSQDQNSHHDDGNASDGTVQSLVH